MNGLKILIVEDEIITALDLKATLEEAGHTVTHMARDFRTAVKAIKQSPPDLALIDIQLNDSSADGITTARELMSLHQMPIIYLTANSEPDTFRLAKETMPLAYLLKPFRSNELIMQIELAYRNFYGNLSGGAEPPKYLFLPVDKGYEKIDIDQVLYLRADGAYVKIFLAGREIPYHISANLGHLVSYFPVSVFYRLSRSLLINLNHLERLEQNHLFLVGHKNAIQVPSSSRRELMRRLTVVRTK